MKAILLSYAKHTFHSQEWKVNCFWIKSRNTLDVCSFWEGNEFGQIVMSERTEQNETERKGAERMNNVGQLTFDRIERTMKSSIVFAMLMTTQRNFCISAYCRRVKRIETDSITVATQSTSNHFSSLLIAIDYVIMVLYIATCVCVCVCMFKNSKTRHPNEMWR